MIVEGSYFKCALFLLFVCLFVVFYAHADSDFEKLKGYRIVCLYNHKQFFHQNFSPDKINPNICTHINYEFAILDPNSYEMIPGEPAIDIDKGFYKQTVDLRNKNPDLKVLISLGGWQDSTKKYSDLVEKASLVDNFINKAVIFLRKHSFDGLDVAWEYPNCWQGALGVKPDDKKNFAEFLEKIRKRFDRENFILSASVAAIKREIENAYIGPILSKEVHFINVMTYDMHGPWEPVTGHHTQMEEMAGDSDPFCNTEAAIKTYIDMGVEKRKINVGLATYGKSFTLADPKKHGLNAPAKGAGKPGPITKQPGILCYHEICRSLNDGNWTEEEDKQAGFYAHSGDQWVSYDSPMMVVRKAKWVVMSKLGGVLVKDVSCDDHTKGPDKQFCMGMDYPLIQMIKMEIIHRAHLEKS